MMLMKTDDRFKGGFSSRAVRRHLLAGLALPTAAVDSRQKASFWVAIDAFQSSSIANQRVGGGLDGPASTDACDARFQRIRWGANRRSYRWPTVQHDARRSVPDHVA